MLGALSLLGLSLLLPACSGCHLEIERSPTGATGLFEGIAVGGTEPDGLFVVALREDASGELDATIVSLGEEPRMCALGRAISYGTVGQSPVFGEPQGSVDDRPGRVLVVEGEAGDTSGTLRVFDVSCGLVLLAPEVELPVRWTWDADFRPVAVTARAVDGPLLWIDPWAPEIRTLGEHVSAFGRLSANAFWLVEDGVLVVRDAEGNALASVGSGVTEVASAPDGTELAFVGEGGLFAVDVAALTSAPIATGGAPCKPKYLGYSPDPLTYRADCAAGDLVILDRSAGKKQVFSSAVTDVDWVPTYDAWWIFFVREPPGGDRELWAVPEGEEPVFVGLDPAPELYRIRFREEHGFFVLLDHDGDTGTFGAWTRSGGFDPLLERASWPLLGQEHLAAGADREGDVGALVALDLETLDSALRRERVAWKTVRFSAQAPLLGYVHGWNSGLGAGTFEVWVPATGQQIAVDHGVSEIREIFWPRPGVVYAVRTRGREGLWMAHPDL
jgi:hypothetical protein